MTGPLDDLRAAVERLRASQPALVGIDGPSGAGTSTLARSLPDVTVVEVDDFYRPMDPARRASLDPQEGYELYFDWQRLQAEVLEPLIVGQPAVYERYDWERDELGSIRIVEPTGVIVVEGVYVLRPQLRTHFDLTVFVDTPRDERLLRCRARAENPDEWIERWMAAEDWYLEHVRPQDAADLVVPGV